VKHDFAYTGLVHCGHCGCVFVGELKKRKYVYYHCTGNRGKCPEPYTRQEVLTREFAGILRESVIPQPILEWLGDAVLTSDRTEQAAHAQAIKKLQVPYDQIKTRIETMYLDKLDGRITQELFDKHSATFRRDQDRLLLKIQDLQKATPLPIDQAVDMLRLTSRASELFLQQPAAEQRRLLRVVVEKAAWQDSALRTTLFEPFEILRHSNQESYRKEKANGGSGRDMEIWLPRSDSNRILPGRCRGPAPIVSLLSARAPMRILRRLHTRVPLHRGHHPALSGQAVRSAARPHRPPYWTSEDAGSAAMRQRVEQARALQRRRGFYNAHIPPRQLRKLCAPDDAGERTLEMAVRKDGA
jgi:magnesium chelatase subunit ChlI-like protein/recombinase-like zinc beta ribbon protein